jgi:Family of unknown function (DUF6504)
VLAALGRPAQQMHRFIDETVEVERAGDLPEPVRFRWRGESFEILEVQQRWSDWHFGAGSYRKSWRNRRHRNYYRVRTAEGVYELYLDRNVPDPAGRWILYQEIVPAPDEPKDPNRW